MEALKCTEKVFLTDCKQPSKKGKANPRDSNKCKMLSLIDPIPKKNHQDANHCDMWRRMEMLM